MNFRLLAVSIAILFGVHFFVNCSGHKLDLSKYRSETISSHSPVDALEQPESTTDQDNGAAVVGDEPEKNCNILSEVFEDTYYNFFNEQRCNDCHSPAKRPAIPGFAQESVGASFLIFESIGPQRIDGKLQGGHQGYLYSDHQQILEDYRSSWEFAEQEQNSCESEDTETIGLLTEELNPGFHAAENDPLKCGLNFDLKPEKRDWQTISWDLEKSKKSLKGVTFSIDIIVENIEFGVAPDLFYCPTRYRVRNPRITTGDAEIFIKSIKVKLNADDQGVTTFSWLEATIPPQTVDYQLDANGSSVPYENPRFSHSDTWSVEIDQAFDTRL